MQQFLELSGVCKLYRLSIRHSRRLHTNKQTMQGTKELSYRWRLLQRHFLGFSASISAISCRVSLRWHRGDHASLCALWEKLPSISLSRGTLFLLYRQVFPKWGDRQILTRVTLGFLKPLRHSSHAKNVKEAGVPLHSVCVCVFVHAHVLTGNRTHIPVHSRQDLYTVLHPQLPWLLCLCTWLSVGLWTLQAGCPLSASSSISSWRRFARTVSLHLTHLILFGLCSNLLVGWGGGV